jgi:mRNA interferase MazF
MVKDFDTWNGQKKNIDRQPGGVVLYHAREVWWAALGTNIGFEQDGDGDKRQRPVLILKGFSKEVCIIIPLTTSPKLNAYRIDAGRIDGKDAVAIISQLRLIDTRRLLKKVEMMQLVVFDRIRKAAKDML